MPILQIEKLGYKAVKQTAPSHKGDSDRVRISIQAYKFQSVLVSRDVSVRLIL